MQLLEQLRQFYQTILYKCCEKGNYLSKNCDYNLTSGWSLLHDALLVKYTWHYLSSHIFLLQRVKW